MAQFCVGDKAVYPAQGVTEIIGVETKEIMGTKQEFYVLRVLDSEKKIMIPVDKVKSVGLREVINGDTVSQVYAVLKRRESRLSQGNWNRRYRAYIEKIKSGSATEVAEVLRDLNLLKYDKNLSFGERKMLDTARRLLVQELSVAQALSESAVESQIESLFAA
ncbi:MAG: CarD family transcriptional regulator [Bradymonadales bacterium]|nr:CarD family transcriptional regulator [Bradymonadales bacterium]